MKKKTNPPWPKHRDDFNIESECDGFGGDKLATAALLFGGILIMYIILMIGVSFGGGDLCG